MDARAENSRATVRERALNGPRTALERTLLWQQVHRVLHDAIISGRLSPGDRIVELETARELNVSQTTVREALKQLAHEGLVLQLPRRGTYVASIDEDHARHAYRLRAAVERFAAAEFCLHAPDEAIELLEGQLEAMRQAAAANDVAGLVERDGAFHREVWRATGNPLLPRVWSIVETSMRNLTLISNRVYFDDLAEVAETHVPLLAALRHRAADRAPDLFADHVMEVWRQIDHLSSTRG
jgi:DNA-binding GntR family transcriptional regulator